MKTSGEGPAGGRTCDFCGQRIPARSRSCKSCGYDERMGQGEDDSPWPDGIGNPGTSLDDEDYERFLRNERLTGPARIRRGLRLAVVLATLLALALLALRL